MLASRAIRIAAVSALALSTVTAAQAQSGPRAAGVATAMPADGRVALFDGTSLEGWDVIGGSMDAWAAVDGELRVVRPGQGGWIRTERMYRDFDLELEFFLPPGGNSGVGLRCSSTGDPAFTGMEAQIYDTAGKETSRSSCGAIYNAIRPAEQAVRPAGQWNSYRILLVGDTINIWLNGVWVQRGEKLDHRGIFRTDSQPLPLADRLTTGYIALQDHGDAVRFRNIRIADLSPDRDPGGFTPAFEEQNAGSASDISGWFARGGGSFTIKDGTMIAADGPGHLFSERVFTDVELRAFVRVALPQETGAPRPGNSGIYLRGNPPPANPDSWPLGYECQIDHHDGRTMHYTGCIYDAAAAATGGPITRDGAWFDYRVRAIGDRVQTWINGRPMADAELGMVDEGRVAFQTHHQGNRVEFRDVQWRVPAAE